MTLSMPPGPMHAVQREVFEDAQHVCLFAVRFWVENEPTVWTGAPRIKLHDPDSKGRQAILLFACGLCDSCFSAFPGRLLTVANILFTDHF